VLFRSHTPRFCGLPFSAGALLFFLMLLRPFLTSWLTVGKSTLLTLATRTSKSPSPHARRALVHLESLVHCYYPAGKGVLIAPLRIGNLHPGALRLPEPAHYNEYQKALSSISATSAQHFIRLLDTHALSPSHRPASTATRGSIAQMPGPVQACLFSSALTVMLRARFLCRSWPQSNHEA
jgi:hypothetical protein